VNDNSTQNVTAIIVAGGEGVRLGYDLPKPLVTLHDRPLVAYSLEIFEKHPAVTDIVLVAGEEWLEQARKLGVKWAPEKLAAVVPGGTERVDSVRKGVQALPVECNVVAVHDAARPFISFPVIDRVLTALNHCDGAVPGVPLVDTLRKQQDGFSDGIIDRSETILTQTPQCFHRTILEDALARAEKERFFGTDDASYVERIPGKSVAIVKGDPDNFKITTSEDLKRAEMMLSNDKFPLLRCGAGFDAHRFTTGRKLILGGEHIPFDLGLHGHSDADVLCHAIGDALLGAVSLGDLGQHFPDSDPQYKGVSSIELLKKIREMVAEKGYAICNVDATIVVQLPKIAPYREAIRENLSNALQLEIDRVSVKATTTEGMGPFGRGEGIACNALALVLKG